MALKFISHFAWIAIAMNPPEGERPLWDDEDGFYYDVMRMPDGQTIQLKVRSLVGLLPICAATVFDGELLERFPGLIERAAEYTGHFAERAVASSPISPTRAPTGRRIAALVDETRLRRILSVMLDEAEFLGPHGIRAISRRHLEQPCRFDWGGQEYLVQVSAGGVRHRHVRRQLQLARPGVVPDEPRDPARADPASPLLRRPGQGRVPDRLRSRDEPARGRCRDQRAA